MNEETAPVAGPRRYRVSFNCRVDAVGTVIGLLIKEVEQPKMEKVGDDYKLMLICMQDQLRAVVDMVLDDADNLIIAPYVPEAKNGTYEFKPPTPARVVTPLQREVTLLPARQHRSQHGPAPTRNTATGKVVLSVFTEGGRVKYPADFTEALEQAGFSANSYASVVNRLVNEGDLVRIGHGAYRLPTTQDHLKKMEERDPSFSSRKGE